MKLLVLVLTLVVAQAASPFSFRKSLSGGGSSTQPPNPDEWWAFEEVRTTGFEDAVGSVASTPFDVNNVRPHDDEPGLIGTGIESSSNGDALELAASFEAGSDLGYTSGNDISYCFWFKPTILVGGFVDMINSRMTWYTNGASAPGDSDNYHVLTILQDQNAATGLYIDEISVIDLSDFSLTQYGTVTNSHNGVGNWNFVVQTYDASTGTCDFYLNGSYIATTSNPGEFITSAPYIYWLFEFADVGEQVILDELGLWLNHKLDSSEINWLYNGGLGRTYTDF